MARNRRLKPKKPYPSFPLTAHPNGQWCKKIRGRVHFFGVWAEPEAALQRYHALAADLHTGRTPRASTLSHAGPTVKDACNSFLGWQKDKLDTGEIGARWFEDCRKIVREFAQAVGKERLVADLRPEDFQRYRLKLARRLGVHALTRHVTAIRSVFKYAYDVDLIEDPVKFGKGFANPSAAQKRKAKQKAELENGKKLFRREELVSILDACDPDLRAPVLLGINGGFGNTDCATLPRSTVDLDAGLVTYARPKTGVPRIVPLWPETVAALRQTLAGDRAEPGNERAAALVFLTPTGRPLVRQTVSADDESGKITAANVDELSARFCALLKSLGIHRTGIGFYTLRHTFRTWADESHDQHAIHRIMGHALPCMSGIYVEEIGLERLRAVADHVRRKLWPHTSEDLPVTLG
jgi:integrase